MTMTTYTYKQIDDLTSIMHGAVKLAGDELGVQSFGLQVLDLPGGFDAYPAHDHAHDGQEEVYVVLDGSVDIEVGGERITAGRGGLLRVAAETVRNLLPGPDGVRVLAIGCVPGGAYERPADFCVGGRA